MVAATIRFMMWIIKIHCIQKCNDFQDMLYSDQIYDTYFRNFQTEPMKHSDEESGSESVTESDESEPEPTDPEDSESEPIEHDEQCARIRKLAKSIWKGDDREILGDVCNPEENFYLEIESEHAFYCVSLEKKKIE